LAKVYACKIHGQFRDFALKILEPIPLPAVKHLVKELEVWSSLEHMNVAGLFGIVNPGMDEIEDQSFVRMSFISSKACDTLKNFLAAEKQTSMVRILFALDIANGLEYLHSKDIVHRDLHDGNVLIDLIYDGFRKESFNSWFR
jgi:serine/threonine protein kinase